MDTAVAEAVASMGRAAGTLRVNTLGMAAKQLIAPRLGRFHAAYPEVVLDIVVDERLSDIVAGGFDAGIRVGDRLEKDMVATATPDHPMRAVASPDYLARHGGPKSRPTPPPFLHLVALPWQRRRLPLPLERKGSKWRSPFTCPLSGCDGQAALQGLGILCSYDDEPVRS
jgi:DNA-binding transcriptional LysR family regulator